VSPNPITSAKNLLCYLYQIYGTSVLSGQHGTVNNIYSMTGKYPAILGQDFLVDTATNSVNYWNAGGIPIIRYHMGAPPSADSYDSSLSSTNLANVLTAGTAENTSLIQKLDRAAGYLQTLQDAGAPVLWAPFHEVQANGWFWWSKGTGQQFIQLWKLAFDYLTSTKGLRNLIWLLPYSGSPTSAYYPGKPYVDIGGADTYGTNQPFTSLFSATRNIVGTTMPIPLHECGTIPNPDNMFNQNAAPWVLFNVWFGYETSNNTPAAIQYTYAHSRTITRDELPNLR
jgi:Beta-mannanase